VRALAPSARGLIFQYNFELRTVATVVERIAPAFDGGLRYEEGALHSDTDSIDADTAGRIVDVFLHYGSPSLVMQGNTPVAELAEALAEALSTAVITAPARADEAAAIEARGAYFRFELAADAPISEAVFASLMGRLLRINSFAPNGRTLISAGLTLVLLILPIIIINAQEAIRAVPYTIREASYGLGATRWQTIWRQVLPAALPGIMTGTILSVSRAVGETAPLIVVGAATFLLTDPTSPFSQFTAMPIQIFQWTARPQGQFADIAAAAIIVLLALMLALNATAIVLRNRYSIRF